MRNIRSLSDGSVALPWWRLAATDRATALGLGLAVVLLFGISGGMLWLLGYNYDGLTGSAFTKIHPYSYLVVFLLIRAAFRSGSPVGYSLNLANRRPASFLLLVVGLLAFAAAVLRKEPGMAGMIDTFVLPALLVMLIADAGEPTMARLETLLHVMMTLNALLALVEFVTKTQLFPYRFDGIVNVGDTRSTALQGHPLENAFITSCYILALMTGARSLPSGVRLGLIGLQSAALVAFGGRSGIVVTLLLGGVYALYRVFKGVRGGRVSLRGTALGIAGLAVAPAALSWLAAAGFFNALAERFVSDSGSAHARVEMFAFLSAIPMRDLIIGPDVAHVESLRRIYGLKAGIENPILSLTLYHGGFVTLLLIVALGLFLYELVRLSTRGTWVPILAAIILLNTFESIATKTTLIGKIAVLILCLYHKPPNPRRLRSAAGSAQAP